MDTPNFSELESKENSAEQLAKLVGIPSKFVYRAEEWNKIKQKINQLYSLLNDSTSADPIFFINQNNPPVDIGGFYSNEPATSEVGLTFSEFAQKLLFPATLPGISFNVSNTNIEIGSDYNLVISITFNQNDAGNATSFLLEKNGIQLQSIIGENFPPLDFTEINVLSSFTLQAFVTYNASSNLSAGTINTPLRTITPRLKIFYGAVASIPTNSAQVRALGNDLWDNANQATLQTGTTNTNFVIAIPTSVNNSATLQAQDTTNNVGYEFTFDSAVNVVLPNGDLEEYRIYKVTIDNPFGASANIVINL